MTWALWAILLLAQNFSHGIVSRARNSNSVLYNCVASVFSNGVWFGSQFILIDNFIQVLKASDWKMGVTLGLFYTTFTVIGSVSSQILAMKVIEKRWGYR